MSRLGRFASLMLGACVSLEVDEPELPVCAAQEVNAELQRGVVQLYLLEPPFEICNAVVIAPTLLLTAVNCVTPLISDDELAGFVAPRCAATGAPLEDGNFLERFSMAGPTEALTLVLDDGTVVDSMVRDVFVSSAASTCSPDLAVIELQLGVELPVVPIRLAPTNANGEEVVVVGYDTTEGSLRRHTAPAIVLEWTSEKGSSTLPPRSLALSGDTCAKPGGAVLSPSTGALVGLIQTTERTINCDAAMADPVAVQVAPYRQFLLEVARGAQASLVAEFGWDASGLIAPCER